MSKEGVAAEMDDILNAHLDMAEEHNEDIGMEFDEDEGSTEIEDQGESDFITEESEDEELIAEESGDTGDVIAEDDGVQQELTEEAESDLPPEKPAIKFDEQNNIVDDKGEIVARAGAERRLFQKLSAAEESLKQNTAANEGFRQFADAPQQMGLSPNEAVQGMQLISDLKTKPVEAARAILQEAMQQGYNLHDIIGQQEGVENSSVDMGAIKRMIDTQLAPVREQYNQQQQTEQQTIQQRQAVDEFVNTHEYADVHLDAVKHLMQNNSNLSSERAYFEVKTYALQNGLDFSQPLAPQMEAMQQQQTQVPAIMSQEAVPNPKPMPNGVVNSNEMQEQAAFSSGDDDWDSIVRQSMRDAGM